MFLAVMAVATLAGCANGNVKQPLPKGMKGNLNITKVKVSLAPKIKSTEIVQRLTSAIKQEAAKKRLNKGQAVEMHVMLTRYKGPDNQMGGGRTARFVGGSFQMTGTVKIVNASNKTVLAVYEAYGRHKQGVMQIQHAPYRFMIEKFMYWVMEPIA